ncbi:hypothetical protein OAA91_01450, partial [Fibrobacterales bacterium]|nr:hypothetical protein [Fibrobacterales bacterium]
YGGEAITWTQESEKHPFYLKMGLPVLGETSINSYKVSAKGFDQFLVSKKTKNLILEALKKPVVQDTISMKQGVFSFRSTRLNLKNSTEITSKNLEPRIHMNMNSRSGKFYFVQIEAKPNTQLSFYTMGGVERDYNRPKTGDYWLSTLHSGSAKDHIGVSGAFVNKKYGKILESAFDTLSSKQQLLRRFNLLTNVTLYLWVSESGSYQFDLGGEAKGRMNISRETTGYKRNDKSIYKTLYINKDDNKVNLDEGLYRLKVSADKKGIAELRVFKTSIINRIKSAAGFSKEIDAKYQGLSYLQFPSIMLNKTQSYQFKLNSIHPEVSASIFEKLPLNLKFSHPVYSSSTEDILVPIILDQDYQISIKNIQSEKVVFKLRGDPSPYKEVVLSKGKHFIVVPKEANSRLLSLSKLSLNLMEGAKPKAFPTGKLSPLAVYESIKSGEVKYFDLKRNDNQVYELEVIEPGMYNIETTGRLRTQLILRNRFVTQMMQNKENGIGRNGMLLTYLLPGRYQVQVNSLGESTGRLGLTLKRNKIVEGGQLDTQRDKRHYINQGEGIEYHVNIAEKGRYSLKSFGQNGNFRSRLEDADGWPIVKPNRSIEYKQDFEQGKYKLVSLPSNKSQKRIANLSSLENKSQYSVSGVQRILLNESINSTWNESVAKDSTEEKPPRTPRVYDLEITNAIRVSYILNENLRAKVIHGKDTLEWNRGEVKTLSKGSYRVEVMANKVQNDLDYNMSFNTNDLMGGLKYSINYVRNLNFQLQDFSVVELFSRGTWDVSAELYQKRKDGSLKLLAQNDDAFLDWNFSISKTLAPGEYVLSVKSDESSKQTTIQMNLLKDSLLTDYKEGQKVNLDLKGQIVNISLELNANEEIVFVDVLAKSRIGISIERLEGTSNVLLGEGLGQHISLSTLAGSKGKKKIRVKVWSSDHLNENVELLIKKASSQKASLKQLLSVEDFDTQKGLSKAHAWVKVDLGIDSVGIFEFDEKDIAVKQLFKNSNQFDAVNKNLISSTQKTLWLELITEKGDAELELNPYKLGPTQQFVLEDGNLGFAMPSASELDGKSMLLYSKLEVDPLMAGLSNPSQADFTNSGIAIELAVMSEEGSRVSWYNPSRSSFFMLWNAKGKKATPGVRVQIQTETLNWQEDHVLASPFTRLKLKPSNVQKLAFNEDGRFTLKIGTPRNGIVVAENKQGKRKTCISEEALKLCEFKNLNSDYNIYLIISASKDKNSKDGIKEFRVEKVAENQTLYDKKIDFSEQVLKPGFSFEKYFTQKGVLKLKVPLLNSKEGTSYKLQTRGNTNNWWHFSKEGLLSKGRFKDSSLPEGLVEISHNGGWVKVDLCESSDVSCGWGASIEVGDIKSISEASIENLETEISWFEFDFEKQKVLSIKSEGDFSYLIKNDDRLIKSGFSTGILNDVIALEKGKYQVGIRKVSKQASNQIEFGFKELRALEQSNLPTVLLGAGESVLFEFELRKTSKIGLGIQTDNEVVQSSLYNENYIEIGSGQQQFLSLDSGRYYLEYKVPMNEKSSHFKVKLVGQIPPEDKPTEALVNKIIKGQ